MSDHTPRLVGVPTFWDIADVRYTRRGAMKGMVALAASTAVPSWLSVARVVAAPPAAPVVGRLPATASSLTFNEVANVIDHDHHVAPGYTARVLLRWGDPLFADSP